jgi:MYXO-CTERM domain-containing protein
MSEAERWWSAFSKTVGPAPTFAPAALALVALVLLVATQRHPALRA